MEDQALTLLLYCVPALITGIVAYLFFREHFNNEFERRKYEVAKELNKQSLPIRLQAYERLTLFLERISPNKLLLRVAPVGNNKEDYETLLVRNIEQEFEHNLAQQIYFSDNCWSVINASKSATIQLIRKVAMSEKIDSADKLREAILNEMLDKPAPSNAGLHYIKKEVAEIW